jgi:hypothetical protein
MNYTAEEYKNVKNPRFESPVVSNVPLWKSNALTVMSNRQNFKRRQAPVKETDIDTPIPKTDSSVKDERPNETPVITNNIEEVVKKCQECLAKTPSETLVPRETLVPSPSETLVPRETLVPSPSETLVPGVGISILKNLNKTEIGMSEINPSPQGIYRNMNAILNNRGQIISASNGAEGTVKSISCGEGLEGGVITNEGIISLQENGISSKFLSDNLQIRKGTYTNPEITVDQKGLVVDIKNSDIYPLKRIEVGPGLIISYPEPGVVRLDISPSLKLKGEPMAVTPDKGSNNSQIATTEYVDSAVNAAIQAIIAAMTNSR